MKIGIISDTHGKTYYIKKMIDKIGKIDLLIHLGDHCSDAVFLGNMMDTQLLNVRGNCDFHRDVPNDLVVTLEDKLFFITHGHLYHVKRDLDRLSSRAKALSADIILYGHTHVPEIFFEGRSLYMNPGSASSSRIGRYPTIGMIHLLNGKIVPYIINLNDF